MKVLRVSFDSKPQDGKGTKSESKEEKKGQKENWEEERRQEHITALFMPARMLCPHAEAGVL